MPIRSLAGVSTGALKRELARRLEALPKLMAQRDELNRKIAEIEGSAAAPAAEAPKPAKRRGRPKKAQKAVPPVTTTPPVTNPLSLRQTLSAAFEGKPSVSIADAVKAVLDSGYKSTSKNFPNLITMTLSSDKRFERVGRGLYRLRRA